MNKLKEKLDELSLPEGLLSAKGMAWIAQDSKADDVLFYRLPNEDQTALDSLKKRVSGAKYKWLFTNSSKPIGIENSTACGEEFYEIRALFADYLYPLNEKKIIAITGTNGKTTTVDFIRQLLCSKGLGVLTIGTLGVYLNEEKQNDFSLTSPDFIDLRKTLFKFKERYTVCALEASSHAVHQKRLYGIDFSSVGWTSFSQDHLDYHKTMDDYFKAKLMLAKDGESFVTSPRAEKLNDQLKSKASLAPKIRPKTPPEFLKSGFNKINLEVAVGCLKKIGIEVENRDLESLAPPPGRFNVIELQGRTFVIDFAHTPDALSNVGRELRRSYPDRKIITVFGCGGDRDRSKRKLMGEAASSFSDALIVTSDNPRTEDPKKIIEDIVKGVSGPFKTIEDRAEAIRFSFEMRADSVILVAGKGHEPYIDINGEKRPYSDEEIIRSLNDRI